MTKIYIPLSNQDKTDFLSFLISTFPKIAKKFTYHRKFSFFFLFIINMIFTKSSDFMKITHIFLIV